MAIAKTSLALLVLVFALVQARRPLHQREPKALRHARDEYFQRKHKRGAYYIRQDSKSADCTFKGYAPNGPATSLASITAPKATMDAKKGLEGVMSGPLKKLGQGAAVVMHAVKFSASIMKNFPAFAPALGVFSALSAIAGGSSKPSPQDILDKANEAIEELTDEVNKKFKEMENYVDASIAENNRKRVTAEYQAAFRLWAGCIKEPDEESANKCQKDALTHAVARRPIFTPDANLLKQSTFSMKQVRKWEAFLVAFRDYANLVIMQLITVSQYYCIERPTLKHSPHYCQTYTNELISEATYLINYAKHAVAAIKKGHWGTKEMGPCPNTQSCKCQDIVEGAVWGMGGVHTADGCSCKCEIMNANKKKYCQVGFTIRRDGNNADRYYRRYYSHIAGTRNFNAASQFYGKSLLNSIAKDYQRKNHALMDKYWNVEVLDFVPDWEKAIQLARALKLKNPAKESDAKPVLDEGFSPQYQTRLANTGYNFKEMEKLDGTFKVAPQEIDSWADEEIVTISCEDGNCQNIDDEEEEDDAAEESNVAEFNSYSSLI